MYQNCASEELFFFFFLHMPSKPFYISNTAADYVNCTFILHFHHRKKITIWYYTSQPLLIFIHVYLLSISRARLIVPSNVGYLRKSSVLEFNFSLVLNSKSTPTYWWKSKFPKSKLHLKKMWEKIIFLLKRLCPEIAKSYNKWELNHSGVTLILHIPTKFPAKQICPSLKASSI